MPILDQLRNEWPVIKAAPWSAAVLVAVGLVVGGGVITALDHHEIETLEMDRDFAQHQLSAAQTARNSVLPATPTPSAPVLSSAPLLQPVERPKTERVRATHDLTTAKPSPHVFRRPLSQNNGVVTYNQSGGIAANTVNMGPQQRHLTDPLRQQFLAVVPKDKPLIVQSVLGDSESQTFAAEVTAFLKASGYTVKDEMQGVFNKPIAGIGLDRSNPQVWAVVVGSNLPAQSSP